MDTVLSTALSGARAEQLRAATAGHNLANLQTADFRRLQVQQSAQAGGGVQAVAQARSQPGAAMADDLVALKQAEYVFKANLRVIETQRAMQGALLDIRA